MWKSSLRSNSFQELFDRRVWVRLFNFVLHTNLTRPCRKTKNHFLWQFAVVLMLQFTPTWKTVRVLPFRRCLVVWLNSQKGCKLFQISSGGHKSWAYFYGINNRKHFVVCINFCRNVFHHLILLEDFKVEAQSEDRGKAWNWQELSSFYLRLTICWTKLCFVVVIHLIRLCIGFMSQRSLLSTGLCYSSTIHVCLRW